MIKRSIQQGDITIKYIHAPYVDEPKYIQQILIDIKEEINSNTIIVENNNSSFISMDRSSRQKINNKTLALNDTLDKMNLIDISRTFHPEAVEYILFT